MPRPIWKGHITFGLVTIPVIVHSAEKQFDLHFRLLDSRDQARVRYERVNEETGEEVSWQDIVKGFEYEEGKYVVLKDEDFKKVAVEVNNAVEIERFVDSKQIDFVYYDKPYYLIPDKKGEKGYVLLREVLRRTGKVGIAKVVIRTRQYLAALMPHSKLLVLELLRFHQEIRGTTELDVPEGSVKSYNISEKELALAQQLVESMTTKWEPHRYHDEYREALMKWIEKKSKPTRSRNVSKSATRDKKAGSGKVIDMMGLLKKSMRQAHSSNGGKKRKSTPTRQPRKAG